MPSRIHRLVNKLKRWINADPLTVTVDRLKKTHKMLEEEQAVFIGVVSHSQKKAKELNRAKNTRVRKAIAKKHQKMEQMYNGTIELFGNYELKIIQQIITLQRAAATIETVNVLTAGETAIKDAIKEMLNIADVPNSVDGINEQHRILGRIEAVVQHPFLDKDLKE